MAKKIVDSKDLPPAIAPYSQCVVGEGSRFVFIAGQVPVDAHGNLVGPNDIEAQARQILANLKIAVEAAGGTVADICKITIFMVSLDDTALEAVGRVRREFFDTEYPASTLVEVSRLVSPDWLLEIEAYAVLNN